MSTSQADGQVDILSPHLWVPGNESERDRVFAELRRDSPVTFHCEPENFIGLPQGPGFWSVVRNEDIRTVSLDPTTFSAEGALQYFESPAEHVGHATSLVEMDPPMHTRHRAGIQTNFSMSLVSSWRDDIRRITREVLAEHSPRGAAQMAEGIAREICVRVFSMITGMPAELHDRLIWASQRIVHSFDTEVLPNGFDSIGEAYSEWLQLGRDVMEHARRHPGENFATALLETQIEDDDGSWRPITEDEYISFFTIVVSAGVDTTPLTMAHGVWALQEHPEQYQSWRADPAMGRRAIEEILRWASPQYYVRRVATRDTTLGGVDIAAGDKLLLWYLSGNRDERVFEDPYRFDITRARNPHLAFGGGGPHFCLGAPIARLELKIFFEELFSELPDLELVGTPERLHTFNTAAIKHMPVKWSPRTIVV